MPPILTLPGIAAIRRTHGLRHGFDSEVSSASLVVLIQLKTVVTLSQLNRKPVIAPRAIAAA